MLTYFAIVNIYYSTFSLLLKGFLSWPKLQENTSYCKLYGKLIKNFYLFFANYKNRKKIKSKNTKYNNNDAGYLFSDKSSKSKSKKNIDKKTKNNLDGKSKNNIGKKSADNTSRNNKILNVKLIIKKR